MRKLASILMAIMLSAAVIGFAGCSNGSDSGGSGLNYFTGTTWAHGSETFSFTADTVTYKRSGQTYFTGSYTVNTTGLILTATVHGETKTITLSSASATTFIDEGDTYTKQ